MARYCLEDARQFQHRNPDLPCRTVWALDQEDAVYQHRHLHGSRTMAKDWKQLNDQPPPKPGDV